MKKIIMTIALFFALMFSFALYPTLNVKASGENDGKTVSTINGASIRTAEPLGLRFAGEVSEEFVGTEVLYGFLITRGTVNKTQMLDRFDSLDAIKVDCGELDNNNRFYLSIVNIASKEYKTKFSALAYVSVDGVTTYAESVVTRCIYDIAQYEVTVNESDNAFVNKIYKSSTFEFDGGSFVKPNSFEIGAINDGVDGLSGITLCMKGMEATSFADDWYKISVKSCPFDYDLCTIVECAPSGVTLTDDDYEMVIAAYENNVEDYAKLEDIASNPEYFVKLMPTSYYGTDMDLLTDGRLYLLDGTSLPLATKAYYDFMGWYDNALFEGDPVTTKSGNDAETFYAKFTLHEYHLTYDLQGGEVDGNDSLAQSVFTVASSDINLPIANRMTKDGYQFVEWNTRADGSGNTITAITSGSHGDITVYAIWQEIVEVELSANDTRTFASITPTKYVKADFTSGTFVISGNAYSVEASHKLYATIADALADVSSNNEIIYVFAGTYTEASLTTPDYTGLKIIGPQYGITANVASPARGDEAVISDALITCTRGVNFDGLKFDSTTAISVSGAGNEIKNCWFNTKGQRIPAADYGLLLFIDGANDLVIENCHIDYYINDSKYASTVISAKDNGNYITNAKIANNYFSGNTMKSSSQIIRFYNTAGIIDISNNFFNKPYCTADLLYVGYVGGTVNIENNEVNTSAKSARIRIGTVHNDSIINIVGNVFVNITGDALSLNTAYHPYLTIKANCFITKAQVNLSVDSTNTVASNNYFSNSLDNSVNNGSYSLTFNLVTTGTNNARYSTQASYCDYLISSIGVVEYTDACYAKITKARAYYDSLTNTVKNMVTQLSTLTSAESTYESLAG
ncbi:MAG: InlB B-repeat-containing protein [Bacilli bacterium]|nr:InlB B-repeat-containing protein [Bacilli bacterium]